MACSSKALSPASGGKPSRKLYRVRVRVRVRGTVS